MKRQQKIQNKALYQAPDQVLDLFWRQFFAFLTTVSIIVILGLSSAQAQTPPSVPNPTGSGQDNYNVTHKDHSTSADYRKLTKCEKNIPSPLCGSREARKTIQDISKRFQDKRLDLEKNFFKDLYHKWVGAKMGEAEQLSTSQVENTKILAQAKDAEAVNATLRATQRVIADEALIPLMKGDGVCKRASLNSSMVATLLAAEEARRERTDEADIFITGRTGTPGANGQEDLALSFAKTFMRSTCSPNSNQPGISENCENTDPNLIGADIDPTRTVFGNLAGAQDPEAAQAASTLNLSHYCNFSSLPSLPSDARTDDLTSQIVVNDAKKIQQQIAQCAQSFAAISGAYAPSNTQMNTAMQAQLQRLGFTEEGIKRQFGENPSAMASLDISLMPAKTVAGAIDSVDTEPGSLAISAQNLSSELLILNAYQDSLKREGRALSHMLNLLAQDEKSVYDSQILRASSGTRVVQ